MLPLPRTDPWSLLALLRFALAFIVAVNHLGEQVELDWLAWVPRLGAFEAVLGFLLISGYSVGTSYLKSPQGFYTRRCKRLYPVYLAALAITLWVSPPVFNASFGFALVVNLLFLNQMLIATSLVGPAWSLSLEFWLYALIPLLNRCSDLRLRQLAWLSFGLYVAYTIGRTLFHWPYYSGLSWGLNVPLLAYVWLCGFRLAKFGARRALVLTDIGLLLGGHLFLAVLIQLGFRIKHDATMQFWTEDLVGYGAEALTLMVVWWIFCNRVKPGMGGERSRWMLWMGDVSYPLYLIHIPVFMVCVAAGVRSALVLVLGAVAAAALVHGAVEWVPRKLAQ